MYFENTVSLKFAFGEHQFRGVAIKITIILGNFIKKGKTENILVTLSYKNVYIPTL